MSHTFMFNKELFKNPIYWFSCVALILFAGILVVLNLRSVPHVRNVQVTHLDQQGLVGAKDVSVRVSFSRPMQRQTLQDAVTVEPLAEFDLNWSGDNMQIKFRRNLALDTEYKVSIASSAQDIFGKQMSEDYNFSFRTYQPQFLYLKRDPLTRSSNQIMQYNLATKSEEELIRAEDIKFFGYSNNKLSFITTNEDGSDAFQVWDRETRQISQIPLITTKFQVLRMSQSPVSADVVLLLQEVDTEQVVPVPQGSSFLKLINLETAQTRDFKLENVLDVNYAPDGSAILIRDASSIYYIVSVNGENVIDLGTHYATGGFNTDLNKVVFIDYDPFNVQTFYPNINIYDQQREAYNLTLGDKFVVDPHFLNNSDNLLISEQYAELEGTRGLFQVAYISGDADDMGKHISSQSTPGLSLENPKPSPDDRYVLLERFNAEQLRDYSDMRNFVFQTKPFTGDLVVWDLQQNLLTDLQLSGVDIIWL